MKKVIDFIGNPENRKRLWLYFYISLALVLGADFLVSHEEGHFIWERFIGFGAVYGFVSCVLIIVVSKAVGHMGLMKPEDYYD
jgi:hypothetical protein